VFQIRFCGLPEIESWPEIPFLQSSKSFRLLNNVSSPLLEVFSDLLTVHLGCKPNVEKLNFFTEAKPKTL